MKNELKPIRTKADYEKLSPWLNVFGARRSAKNFCLWQDKEAIAAGTLWEGEIKTASGQSVFFIPIITPTVVKSPYCQFELNSFLAREADLGRSDLVFPILYITVPALNDADQVQADPVLSIIAKRQYVDWRDLRYHDQFKGSETGSRTFLCGRFPTRCSVAGSHRRSERRRTKRQRCRKPRRKANGARRKPSAARKKRAARQRRSRRSSRGTPSRNAASVQR